MSDLAPEVLEPLLHGRFGRPYRFVPECPSTQRLLADDEAEGATAATDFQTADELPADAPKPPTSLRLELGRELERTPLLAAILDELERGYDAWTAPHRRYH